MSYANRFHNYSARLLMQQKYTMTTKVGTKFFLPCVRPTKRINRLDSNLPSFAKQQARSMATVNTVTSTESAASHFKQQKHLPFVLEYLMWVVFGSECLHLIWLKSEYKEYKEHTQYKIALFKELLHLLESNSPVPESLRDEIRMLVLDEKFNKQLYQDADIEDDYLEKLIASSEQVEENKQVSTAAPSAQTSPGPTSTAPVDEKPKQNDFII